MVYVPATPRFTPWTISSNQAWDIKSSIDPNIYPRIDETEGRSVAEASVAASTVHQAVAFKSSREDDPLNRLVAEGGADWLVDNDEASLGQV